MKKLSAGILALVIVLGGPEEAQSQVAIGPEISIAENVDLGIGAVLEMPLSTIHEALEFAGRFTLYFPDGADYWELGGDVRYLFPLGGENQILPYALGGIAIGHASSEYDGPGQSGNHSDTEIGLRIGGGFKVPMARFIPFAELGLGIGDLPDFTLRGGLTFPLG